MVLLLLFLFLSHSDLVFQGASEGLLLWFHSVLPTLFPFFILTSLMTNSSSFLSIIHLISPFLCKVLRISSDSVLAVLGGFTCGYPMGAKIVNDLVHSKRIDPQEGAYILSFCNNASPMFILGFLAAQTLGCPELGLPSVGILYLSPILCSFLFRKYYTYQSRQHLAVQNSIRFSLPDVLDQAVKTGMETILKIGGYIMFFSILTKFCINLTISHPIFNLFLIPSLEITNGLTFLNKQSLFFEQTYVLMMFHTAFGGFCASFQTKCVLEDTPFSLVIYTIEKLITATVTSLLSYLYIRFFV